MVAVAKGLDMLQQQASLRIIIKNIVFGQVEAILCNICSKSNSNLRS